ncbi:hypothetical protein L208DRAFT_1382558 [Tricholoma matsutake]|nr:hypothetical protein L208DRAFT_1382558 [Tricholoma matsutake 945]
MSENPPNGPPFFPTAAGAPQVPQIHYNGAGNPFFQDMNGCWILYFPHTNSMHPIQAMSLSRTSAPAAIDSTLLVLLADSDDDLTDPPTIAKVQGYKPNKRIAGSQQKAKGKQRAQDEQSCKGQRGWQIIHHGYVCWARSHNRPVHTMKSLETKYKQLVKHPKPTGDGYCPTEYHL